MIIHISECNNDGASTWIDEEIARLQEILTKAEFHLRRSNLSKRQRRRYNKRRANTQQFIEKAQVNTNGLPALKINVHFDRN